MNIELSHQAFIQERCSALSLGISEYSFANIYLFRTAHHYQLIQDEIPLIQGVGYDGLHYAMPLARVEVLSQELVMHLLRKYGCLFPVPEESLAYIQNIPCTASCSNSDSDYVYRVSKLCTLAGRDLSSRRNLVHQFERTFLPTSYPLTQERIGDALQILDRWKEHVKGDLEKTDVQPCQEALKLMEKLSLTGYIFYADSKPAGFLLGEELRKDMFVLHFAKADVQYKGIYQYMYQHLAQVLDDRFTWLNAEQDLGKENIRQAKQAFMPDDYIRKYRIISLEQ
jgi:hypothetical protein